MRSNFQHIESYCLGLCTQNRGLREVDLEPSPKRDQDVEIRNTHKKASDIVQPGLTYVFPALREVNLKPSAKKGTQ